MGTRNNSNLFYIRMKWNGLSNLFALLIPVRGQGLTLVFLYIADLILVKRVEECQISEGEFDNVGECRYRVPDYWTIGEVYERVIEDCYQDQEIMKGVWEVYHSWIDSSISDYNTDFYYQPRDYLAACYQDGSIL